MKKIFGLDLGTTSIGWAVVNEAENDKESSSITRLGVRVVPLTVDEQTNFEKGKSITTNAERTLRRSMRRNLERYKARRSCLMSCLKAYRIITADTKLFECGKDTTFQTCRARAKAATQEVTLEEFARVLFQINKKRGYKSSRKCNNTDEGQLIDGMAVAKELYDRNITPGQFVLELLQKGKKFVPDFYRSDLNAELDRIWDFQCQFFPDILTDALRRQLIGKTKKVTQSTFYAIHKISAADNNGKDKRLQAYKWRAEALERQLTAEELVYVISDINGCIAGSSGYLGAISDRSKKLSFNHLTVGQYLMRRLDKNPHSSLKNVVFYRQDYLDEFETIWETQAKFHKELTPELKHTIRDIIIFFQRPLKSKKAMLDVCTFENRQVTYTEDGKTRTKTVGLKVVPKASPLFQEFKIWQILNNLVVRDYDTGLVRALDIEEMTCLARELTYREKLKKEAVLKLLYGKQAKRYDLNYSEVEGNRTISRLAKAYMDIVAMSGHNEYDISKLTADEIEQILNGVFGAIGINTGILKFDAQLQGHDFEQQPMYKLWHLLYSYEGDKSKTGNESLINKLAAFGFERDYAAILAAVTFQDDYGSLSAKAIRNILPFMKGGNTYDVACAYAGYKHSERSLTKEELENKQLKSHLDLLPRNSLRNPVVEKILNQMINVVNALVETYGRPDEIRIEMARELKKSAKEREDMSQAIAAATKLNEKYRKEIEDKFGIPHVSRNDILRYRLYLELKDNGFKTLYSDTYIPEDKLFSKEFDIEHIIPQARLFDDSFSNKTLEARQVNIDKSNNTAADYILKTKGEEGLAQFKQKIDDLFKRGAIGKAKHKKLLMLTKDIPGDFIERDLRNTQYIARKAREILEQMVKRVVPTTGAITDRLREDWGLINVMQELNWDKYAAQGLTETFTDKDGNPVCRIKDWTKRNDHRHHAMDALAIAFTKQSFIQYLNNLNSRTEPSSVAYAIERKELYRDGHKKLRFIMPFDGFRAEARRQLEDVLISIKSKNKVMTWNVNRTKVKGGVTKRRQLTPRGQLHNETVYAHTLKPVPKIVKVDGKMTAEIIALVTSKRYREALMARLEQFGGDPKKAFAGKNSLEKNPLWLDPQRTRRVPAQVKIVVMEEQYPVRKPITPELKLDKVMDDGVKAVLNARLAQFDGKEKDAFSNLDENPIYMNKEKGITVKRVRIRGVQNAVPLHDARDVAGKVITSPDGRSHPVDFVQTSGNHHLALYRDADGKLHDVVVPFMEAVTRVQQGLPVIDKGYNAALGWTFVCTLKQNEYVVFPDEASGFFPNEIDLTDRRNYPEISKHLYRVQYISKVEYGSSCVRDFAFRHHLETTVEYPKALQDITWRKIKSLPPLEGMVKVRVNAIGEIVAVGEY